MGDLIFHIYNKAHLLFAAKGFVVHWFCHVLVTIHVLTIKDHQAPLLLLKEVHHLHKVYGNIYNISY